MLRRLGSMILNVIRLARPYPESTRVYRVKVVTTLLQAGVPLSKADVFRVLLQQNAFNLSDSSNLRKLIPFILQDEISKIKQDIKGRPVAIMFDGTTPRM